MDTSKEYIMMCRMAEEIQSEGRKKGIFTSKHDFFKYVSEGCSNISVWLPRQDQLEEMLNGESWEKIGKLYAFGNSRQNDAIHLNSDKFNTLEKLWLAFVMQKKYKKKWLSEEQKWISF
jgi:hypothetical protein